MDRKAKAHLALTLQLLFMAGAAAGPLIEGRTTAVDFQNLQALDIAGLGLFVLGLCFALAAVFVMKTNFRVQADPGGETKLVRTWPFSMVRNPIYFALILMGAGVSALYFSWVSLLSTVALYLAVLFKAQLEEYYLHQYFGDEYAKYKQEVPRMFPFFKN